MIKNQTKFKAAILSGLGLQLQELCSELDVHRTTVFRWMQQPKVNEVKEEIEDLNQIIVNFIAGDLDGRDDHWRGKGRRSAGARKFREERNLAEAGAAEI